jgi:twitching motility protein PilT
VTNDIKLFANLCIKEGILTTEECQALGASLQPNTELLDFAQTMLEQGREGQFEQIQALLHQAEEMASEGRIAGLNPFKRNSTEANGSTTAARPKIKLPQPSHNTATAIPAVEAPPPPSHASKADSAEITKHVIEVDDVYPAWLSPSRLEGLNSEEMRRALISLLLVASLEGASDLHICTGSRIFVRHHRAIVYKSKGVLSHQVASALNRSILSEQQAAEFEDKQDLDFALPFSTGQRFRVNLMQHNNGISGTYRIGTEKTKSLEELGFPNADHIKELLAYHNGLILVTGPIGSGKTTTLAALIEVLNQTREDHIITVEDPIEIIQESNYCQITQRSIGRHTKSFKDAIKGALRQDPDIIVIGEIRDLETIEMAVSASETGHLVIATMHTSTAATTLNRLLDVFPAEQQIQIRSMVAESLRGIICQRLLPNVDGGSSLACELLLQNMAVSALIREGKTQALDNVMETGRRSGMVQMDQSVLELWQKGIINDEIALTNIRNKMLCQQIRNHSSNSSSSDGQN